MEKKPFAKRKALGFLSLLSLLAFPGILEGDWVQGVWLFWLVWILYFFESSGRNDE